jgi:hypothetical protein
MTKENDRDEEKNQKAQDALVIIAQNLYEKGMIIKKGHPFLWKRKIPISLSLNNISFDLF